MQIITSEFWHRLVDDNSKWHFEFKPNNQKLIFCPMAWIGKFFRTLEENPNPDWKFTLISGGSDHSLHEFESCYYIIHNNLIYDTFDRIPSNVKKWYISGSNVIYDNVKTFIPLGVCDDGPGKENLLNYRLIENSKIYKYYVNWSNHTLERYKLKERWKNDLTGNFLVKESVPWNEFHNDLSHCEYTVCTFGYGLDCYRNYEALCCDSIPILLKCKWAEEFERVMGGCILVDSWLELENKNFNKKPSKPFNWDLVNTEYWKNLIYEGIDV